MLQCYNRGCGLMYDPATNTHESCRYHPGMPYFHDAYKGWTCCNRKSINFTEFLNMKGCSLAEHSNVKPPEYEKPHSMEVKEQIVRKPIVKMDRPPFETPLVKIKPIVVPALKLAVDALKPNANVEPVSNKVEIGTSCKNGGCKCTYDTSESNEAECRYHPGVPIFHEGIKYWSCCQKKTSDFQLFMGQKGCIHGRHKWRENFDKSIVNCRYDWHQTSTKVIVAIYAKLYHYDRSSIELNPIRLKVSLVFPSQSKAAFSLDLELFGMIEVNKVKVEMFPTKVEITMPKLEVGPWSNLSFSKSVGDTKNSNQKSDHFTPKNTSNSESEVDIDNIEPLR